MDLDELFAREQLRDLVARYTWSGDGGDADALAALFTSDGVLDVGEHGGRWSGRDVIRAELAAVADRVAARGVRPGPVRHHVSNLLLEIDGSHASARAYFVVFTAIGVDHWGRYRDRFVLNSDQRWRFAERIVRVDGADEQSLMVPRPATQGSL